MNYEESGLLRVVWLVQQTERSKQYVLHYKPVVNLKKNELEAVASDQDGIIAKKE